ncbi:hypothetical protein [uncultured Cetobacterium sp.]|uniref:hypothetical protein n=1 Tax=uncultured Cetobacterium sp. TaxID=527638 RepID=UPI0026207B23|nr:hypothetical protein [uncultured Cetobacterium sp.]
MDKFIELDLQGKLQEIEASLKDKNKFNEYQLYYNSLCQKDILLVGEITEVNKAFKEKLEADEEHEFLEALINVGFFDE